MSKASILIIDDELQIRRLLTITLHGDFVVSEAATAKEGMLMAASHPPDLVLLDLGLPDENGHDVLRHLREWYNHPIIILSAQTSEEDIVKALDAGASDYLVKPFRTGELLARIRTALRKSTTADHGPVMTFGNLVIDFAARKVTKENVTVKLTATEYSLLALMARNEGRVLTHQHLLREVWGPSYVQESQYLRVFVAQLRKKIEADPNRPSLILTESGVGYRFSGT
ncbi:MAG: response regulator [Cyclobacteriaceae bacterium]|nr:response regulator [Cyclobacteriaceae bacterium]